MLIYTTNNWASCVSNSEWQHCETLLSYRWTHHYITKGAESEQPEGVQFYQWVGCRDHAGIACFLQAQRGPVYIRIDQRKLVFHNMRPLNETTRNFKLRLCVVTKSRYLWWGGREISWTHWTISSHVCCNSNISDRKLDMIVAMR